MLLHEIINRCVLRPDGCISWEGAHDGKGYPHHSRQKRHQRVFRTLYEAFISPVPPRFELHHQCERVWCVNPWHQVPLSKSEHTKRHRTLRTHCPNGHELTPENTYVNRNSERLVRKCRTCEAARKSTPEYLSYMRDYYRRRKASA